MEDFKLIEDIVSSKEEYDDLYNTDHLFIVKGKTLDDNTLLEVIDDLEHYEWKTKLRGPADGPAKLHNVHNNHEWVHGYVIAVSCANLTAFEKSILLTSIKYGYTFNKLDVFQTKKELKEQHFNSLFEVE